MSKEWGIVLTSSEKKTLYKFLALYLGSALVFLSFIGWFFWQMEYHLQRELLTAKMRQNASEITAKITHAHMRKEKLDFASLQVQKGFRLGLYDKDKKPLLSQIKHTVDLDQALYQKKGHLGIVDRSVLGHMGIDYVVIEEQMFHKMIADFTYKVIAVFITIFLLLTLIGYWLAKLFIRPIHNEREKLNTFIKDSTHELNTPITALLMSTSSPNLTSEKNIERIRFSAKRISELYEDLTYLFLRQPEKPTQMLAMDTLLKEQIAYLKPFADKKSIMIEADIHPFSFFIDKESAIRLINNLI